jgi:hypothetical protein
MLSSAKPISDFGLKQIKKRHAPDCCPAAHRFSGHPRARSRPARALPLGNGKTPQSWDRRRTLRSYAAMETAVRSKRSTDELTEVSQIRVRANAETATVRVKSRDLSPSWVPWIGSGNPNRTPGKI